MRYFLFLFALPCYLIGQIDTISSSVPSDLTQESIEDFLQNTDSEGTFDFNTIFEELEQFRENPININTADEAQLRELLLLNDLQILAFLNYRKKAGELISLYELQAVPNFDLPTIRKILPFISVKGNLDDYQLPITEMLYKGQNELYIRWSRILEEQKGFTPLEEGQEGSRYLGDPNRLYTRYKHSYSNKLSYGFTAEKDRGEEFFSGSNPQGFDFYSAHLFIKDYNQTLKALAIGDYTMSFGQGLILYTGFGYGKSSSVLSIKRASRTLRPYSSVNESNFMRGAGATIGIGKNIEFTALASYQSRDGNVVVGVDTSDLEQSLLAFSSFDTDGLHRTDSEIEDENAIDQLTFGGSFKFKQDNWHIAANALFDRFDKPLQRRIRPYNQFFFNGQQLLNLSLDYSYIFQNFNFFGETAYSDNGAVATLNGLLIGLDKKIDLAILHRYFPKDYQALNANPFAETTGARNENGFYIGTEIRPIKNWKLSVYYDTWQHPWLRFGVDAPSRGYEYRARLTFYLKRKMRIYLEIRDERKEINSPEDGPKVNPLVNTRFFQTRFHVSHQLSKSLELRSRLDYGFADNDVESKLKGFALYQDILYKPIAFPISFTTRFAIFDTDGFGVRFYSFENDLLYSFSVPAYYNKGTRFYFNLRYRGIRNMTLEFRYAQTFWSDQNTFGSGLEEIQGQTRSEMAAQIKYKF